MSVPRKTIATDKGRLRLVGASMFILCPLMNHVTRTRRRGPLGRSWTGDRHNPSGKARASLAALVPQLRRTVDSALGGGEGTQSVAFVLALKVHSGAQT